MSQPKHNKLGVVTSIIISVLLVIIAVLIILFRQYIIDQITVWQFQPSSEISNMMARDGMSDYGKFLFYASRPELDTAQNFNSACNRIETTTSILGCYSNNRIYIYDVTDSKLDGIREVTAAHETLHAAYERMSSSDKAKINTLVEAEYKKLQNNKSFADLIAFYDRTEPGERDNELHSIIGTEVADIDPALEAHYKQYFVSRQSVVALYEKYSGVFQNLADRANLLAGQLNTLAQTINTNSTKYNADVQTLNADIAAFNKRAASGDFTSQSEFNTERATLTKRISNLNDFRTTINDDTAKYNTLLVEYNSLTTQSKQLYNSINSTLAPAPSV